MPEEEILYELLDDEEPYATTTQEVAMPLQGQTQGGVLPWLERQVVRGAFRATQSPFEFLQTAGQLGELATGGLGVLTGVPVEEKEPEPLLTLAKLPALFESLAVGSPFPFISPGQVPELTKQLGITGQEQIGEFFKSRTEPGALEPRNFPERVIDTVASAAPALAVSGLTAGGAFLRPFLSGLARETITGTTKEAIKSFGGGPVAQFIGSLGSALGYDFFTKVRNPGEIMDYLKNKKSDRYSTLKESGKEIERSGESLLKSTGNQQEKLWGKASRVGQKYKSEINKELEAVNSLVEKGNVNIADVIEQKQHLNGLWSDATNKGVRNYYGETVSNLNEIIKKVPNKKFLNSWNQAENMTEVLNTANKAEKLVKDVGSKLLPKFIGKGPVSSLIKATGWMLGDIAQLPGGSILMLPDAQKYMGKVITSSIAGNEAAISRNLKNLEKVVQEKPIKYELLD